MKPPCNIKNIIGLQEDGSITVRLDDDATLVFKLGKDDDDISW